MENQTEDHKKTSDIVEAPTKPSVSELKESLEDANFPRASKNV